MFLLVFLLVIGFFAWYQMKYGHRNLLLSRVSDLRLQKTFFNNQSFKIPGPKKYPLVHNTLAFYGSDGKALFKMLVDFRAAHGPVFNITTDPFDNSTIVVADPNVAEVILSSQKLIDKSEDYDLMKSWLGTGLLISTGKKVSLNVLKII